MLVLSRKKNESLVITDSLTGETLTVTVAGASGRVTLGIEASRRFVVEREEIRTRADTDLLNKIRLAVGE